MGMRNAIAFCGSMITDQVKMISRWPDPGMLVPIESVTRSVGGSVCNTAIDLKTLDPSAAVRAIGAVGADDNGAFVIRTMEACGIDCSCVSRRAERPTTFTDVMTVSSTGARTFFNMHGADSLLTPEDVDATALDCDVFHFGYLLLLDGMDAPDEAYGTKAARLLAKVRSAGVKTSIDIVSEQSDRFARIVRPALRHCDYCIVNEVEGALATGRSPDDLKGLCEGLFELGVHERVVLHRPDVGVTMDAHGAFARVPSLRLPKGWIRGSVGAGDAFCAGALCSILKGLDAETILRVGSCAAAMNLAVPDSVSGAKSLEETMALESRFGRLSCGEADMV